MDNERADRMTKVISNLIGPLWILAWTSMTVGSYFLLSNIITTRYQGPSTAENCLSTVAAHVHIKSCVTQGRPPRDCLEEAHALCLKDLADKGE